MCRLYIYEAKRVGRVTQSSIDYFAAADYVQRKTVDFTSPFSRLYDGMYVCCIRYTDDGLTLGRFAASPRETTSTILKISGVLLYLGDTVLESISFWKGNSPMM